MRNVTFWKTIFFISLLMALGGMFMIIQSPTLQLSTWVNIVISVVGVVPLFGLAFQRSLLYRNIWISFLLIEVISLIKTFVAEWLPLIGTGFYSSKAIPIIIVAPILLIQLYGHFLYAFRSADLWGRYNKAINHEMIDD
jgi:hypothetical protein